jgi:uncharacterized lipoprotein YmbA
MRRRRCPDRRSSIPRESRIVSRGLVLTPLALLIALVLGGGCMGRSAPARYYVLAEVPRSPVAAPSAEPGRGSELGIGPVTLPRYLDRTNIVTRRGAEIEVAEFERWGEPLSDSVPRAIAANLATLLHTERIVIFPWPSATNIEHQVMIDIIRFDGRPGGDVLLEARWRVLGREKNELALRYSALTEATGEPGYPALVAAMSRSLAMLSREIADAVKTLRVPSAGGSSAAGLRALDGPARRGWSGRSVTRRTLP